MFAPRQATSRAQLASNRLFTGNLVITETIHSAPDQHNFRVARHSGVIAKFTGPVLRLADIATSLDFSGSACLIDLTGFLWNGWACVCNARSRFFRFTYRVPVDSCDSWAQNNLQRYRRNLRGEMGSDIFNGAPAEFRVIKADILGNVGLQFFSLHIYLRVIPLNLSTPGMALPIR